MTGCTPPPSNVAPARATCRSRVVGWRSVAFVIALAGWPFSQAAADPVQSIRYLWSADTAPIVTAQHGATAQTPFAIASIGKTMTAVAVLQLVDEGRLSLDLPVAQWLSQDVVNGVAQLNRTTLRHLLTMTSGLPDYYAGDYIEDALDDPEATQVAAAAITYVYGEPALFDPGQRFDYSNTNYLLLGMILEQVTGQSYGQVIKNRVLVPAGMSGSFVFGTRALPADFPAGHEGRTHMRDYYEGAGFGDGGIIASAQDLALFYHALFIERSLLSDPLLAQMLRDPVGAGYGMGLDISGGIYGHSGGDLGFSSDVRFDPDTGRIAIELVARPDADLDWPEDALLGD